MQSGKTLFGILDLPSPPLRFERYNDVILRSLETVATESMVTATEEAVELNTFNENDMAESEICNPRDLTVAIDGTWQRRGFSSLNGVVSVSSIDSGKILDVQVLTKYCHTCSTMLDKSKPHECKNFEGSSGSMELEGRKQYSVDPRPHAMCVTNITWGMGIQKDSKMLLTPNLMAQNLRSKN